MKMGDCPSKRFKSYWRTSKGRESDPFEGITRPKSSFHPGNLLKNFGKKCWKLYELMDHLFHLSILRPLNYFCLKHLSNNSFFFPLSEKKTWKSPKLNFVWAKISLSKKLMANSITTSVNLICPKLNLKDWNFLGILVGFCMVFGFGLYYFFWAFLNFWSLRQRMAFNS